MHSLKACAILCMFIPTACNAFCRSTAPVASNICVEYPTCMCEGDGRTELTLVSPRVATCDGWTSVESLRRPPLFSYSLASRDKHYIMLMLEYRTGVAFRNTGVVSWLKGDIQGIDVIHGQASGAVVVNYISAHVDNNETRYYQFLLFEHPSANHTDHAVFYGSMYNLYQVIHSNRRWPVHIFTSYLRRFDLCDKMIAGFQVSVSNNVSEMITTQATTQETTPSRHTQGRSASIPYIPTTPLATTEPPDAIATTESLPRIPSGSFNTSASPEMATEEGRLNTMIIVAVAFVAAMGLGTLLLGALYYRRRRSSSSSSSSSSSGT